MKNVGIRKADASYCRGVTRSKTHKLFAVVVALVFVVFVGDVFAQTGSNFGGRPAFPRADNPRTESIFIHTLEPGDVQAEGVLVVNNTDEQKTILVYGTDSTPSTGGAFACEQAGQEKNDVGAWIELEESEVTLAPGNNRVVLFTISVPQSASVGEHNGCIITQEKKEASVGAGISLSFRTGLRVAITIPGELIRKLEIVGLTVTRRADGDFIISPRVRNTGNVSIDSNVQVVTRYFFGLVLDRNGGEFPILRGETSDWNFELAKPFWGGWYRANFTVEYDGNPEAGVGIKSGKELTRLESSPVWFFSFPRLGGLIIEILVLLLILFAIFLLWLSRRREKWIKENWVNYKVKPGEDVNSLADRFNTSWKLIAKVNRLQPPYTLKIGQNIKVPPPQ